MVHLEINFHLVKHTLSMEYFRWLLIFEGKFFFILATVALFRGAPRLVSTYVVQFFLLYKMVKKYLGKRFPLVSKFRLQWSKNTDFWWFFSQNQWYWAIFDDIVHFHDKINMLARISTKNSIEWCGFQRKNLFIENWPVVPLSLLA
jgi:hypothetical protein